MERTSCCQQRAAACPSTVCAVWRESFQKQHDHLQTRHPPKKPAHSRTCISAAPTLGRRFQQLATCAALAGQAFALTCYTNRTHNMQPITMCQSTPTHVLPAGRLLQQLAECAAQGSAAVPGPPWLNRAHGPELSFQSNNQLHVSSTMAGCVQGDRVFVSSKPL